jgi:L-amino acid N-acyltransferase YncA
MEMNLRLATSNDAAVVAEIYNYYILTSVITFEEVPVTETEMSARIAEVQSISFPWIVAERNGCVAGFAYGNKWKARAAYKFASEVTVYVRSGLGATGIGSALYGDLMRRLKDKGLHTAIGGIALPNEASVKLHEKLGFRKVAHFEQVGFKFNRWVDVAYWQRTV